MGKNVPSPPTRLSTLPARLRAHAANGRRGCGSYVLSVANDVLARPGADPVADRFRPADRAGSEVSATEAISAASATVGDLRGFCARQPDACTVGSQVATAIGYKAQAGAKMLYEVLSEAMAPRETGSVAGASRNASGANRRRKNLAVERTSQSTLTPADLVPAWRGPPRARTASTPSNPNAAAALQARQTSSTSRARRSI